MGSRSSVRFYDRGGSPVGRSFASDYACAATTVRAWVKRTGIARVRLPEGEIARGYDTLAEIHWLKRMASGRKELKIKRLVRSGRRNETRAARGVRQVTCCA